MPSPLQAGRPRFSLKASHRRLSLRSSHRRADDERHVAPTPERDRYIAPPKRRR